MRRPLALAAAAFACTAVSLVLPPAAHACGGFFPNKLNVPAEQTGVRVLMVRDGKELEVHIGLSYAGPAEDFAWLMPVPTVPELSAGVDALFFALDAQTHPVVHTGFDYDVPDCDEGWEPFESCPDDRAFWPAPLTKGTSPSQAKVLASGGVGPYETVVINAKTGVDVQGWLNDHGYAVPSAAVPLLQSYVAQGYHFVAARLKKGKTTGDIAPIILRMQDAENCLPLRLASVSTKGVMPIVAWIVGEGLAVPKNAMVVTPNEVKVNWLDPYANYSAVLEQAVAATGGPSWVIENYRRKRKSKLTTWLGHVYDAALDITDAKLLERSGQLKVNDKEQLLAAWWGLRSVRLPLTPQVLTTLKKHGMKPQKAAAWSDNEWFDCLTRCHDKKIAKTCVQPCAAAADKGLSVTTKAMMLDLAELMWPLRELYARLEGIVEVSGENTAMTRLATRLGPQQLDRDMLFSLRTDLGDYGSSFLGVCTEIAAPDDECDDYWGWQGWGPFTPVCDPDKGEYGTVEHLVYKGHPIYMKPGHKCAGVFGVSAVFVDSTQPPLTGPGSIAAFADVIDEQGRIRRIHPDDYDKVSAALAGAKMCEPSLSADLVAGLKATPQSWFGKDLPEFTGCSANPGGDAGGGDGGDADTSGVDAGPTDGADTEPAVKVDSGCSAGGPGHGVPPHGGAWWLPAFAALLLLVGRRRTHRSFLARARGA